MIKLGVGLAASALLVIAATQMSYSADMAVAPAPIGTACPGGPFSGFWAGGNLDGCRRFPVPGGASGKRCGALALTAISRNEAN
jgi:hypothetical protein